MIEGQIIDYVPTHEIDKIKFDVGVTTKSSDDHPGLNEDVCLVNISQRTYGIFDGMGGLSGGQIAAKTSSDVFNSGLNFVNINHTTPAVIENNLATILNCANTAVMEKQKTSGVEMGSTATVATIISSETDTHQLCAVHVGDSRIYIFRDGVLKRVTTDNNIIEQEDPKNYDYHQNILDNFDGRQRLTPAQEKLLQKTHEN